MELNPKIESLQGVIDNYTQGRKELNVLEAGCGSSTRVDLPESARIAGIDISKKQLERNEMLDEKICGDIQTHTLPAGKYHVIISWFVLEHVANPVQALRNFVEALQKDGLIILALPNVYSLKGFVTKFTPYFIHVAFYRYILGQKDAGEDDTVPFPTYLRFSISPRSLKKYAAEHGLSVAYFQLYDGKMQQRLLERNIFARWLYIFLGGLVKIISMNRLDLVNNNFAIVLQKGR